MTRIDPVIFKRLRKDKGLSQDRLAVEAKMTKKTIARLERGDQRETRKSTIQRLAAAMRIDPLALTGEEPISAKRRQSGA